MEDKLILARALYDWTVQSRTTFIDENPKLQAKLETLGLKFPNPDLALFETIYCELDIRNRNGVTLPKEVAEQGLNTLIGKQINFEHEGAGHICGYIIDARIEKNFIIVDGVIFKSVWKEEFNKVKKYFEDGKLHVSFELWNQEDGASIVDTNVDGSKKINKMIAHGCGLLMEQKPACPKATVTKLFASDKIVNEAEKIIESVFQRDDKLVYAELSIVEECKHCADCEFERRTTQMEFEDTEIEEVALSTPRPCKNCGQNLGEGQEGDYCPGCVAFEQEFNKWEEVMIEAAIPAEVLKRVKELRKEGKSMKEAMKTAWSEFKEKTRAAEEQKLAAARTCKNCGQYLGEGQEGEYCPACKGIESIKEGLEKASKEIETLKEELDKKNQEIESLKITRAAETQKEGKPELTVGSVDTTSTDELISIGKKVNVKAFGHE